MEDIKKIGKKVLNWAKDHEYEIATVLCVAVCTKAVYNWGYVTGYIQCVCDVMEAK